MTRLQKIVLGLAALLAVGLLLSAPGMAVLPDEKLDDPALEERARVISKDIRCLVCQNQSIDDSNADLARDLRIIVRERLVAGDSNSEVKTYLVERYGEYVLLTPPVSFGTIFLWGGPFVLVALGAIAIFFWFRGRTPATAEARPASDAASRAGGGLSAEEKARLDALMADDDGKADGR